MEQSQVQRTSLPKPKDLHLALLSKTMSPKMSNTQIYSPVTDLAMGLGELSTSGYGNTPKRRLSLAPDGTPTPTLKPIVLEKQLSADAGFEDGCGLEDSPFLSSRFGDLLNAPLSADKMSSSKSMFQSSALRRFHSMPVPFCGFEDANTTPEVCSARSKLSLHTPFSPCSSPAARSPAKFSLKFADDDETSQDSGFCVGDAENLSQPEGKLLATDFRFAEPSGRAPARRASRVLSDETNNLLYSPTKAATSHSAFSLFRKDSSPASSPVKLHRSSLTSGDDEDDGFLELVDVDDMAAATTDAPSSISGLFTNPLLTSSSSSSSEDDGTPLRRRAFSQDSVDDQENRLPVPTAFGSGSKRGLFRSPSCPRSFRKSVSFCPTSRQGSSKRSEPDSDITPVQTKRRKSMTDDMSPMESARTLQRCHSETEALIKSAMLRREEEPNLIGDLSRSYALPLCKSKHQDLKAISPETMAALLNGEFDDTVERAIIVDARYPYEYEGGHIRGALNLWTRDTIQQHFLAPGRVAELNTCSAGKRTIIIFHCEFSSERGPRMCRFLRTEDRNAHRDTFPYLDFPELYLLEGGYKAFFYGRQELCQPHTYKPMIHADHGDDLRHFRAKSKSWAGEKTGRKGRVPFRPSLKL